VCEREGVREIESERQRDCLFLLQNSVLRDPWTVHAIKSHKNNGSNEFLRVQQRSRSHACVACKAAAIAAAPGFLFTKLNTSGIFSLPKLS
jgi:hypothetical protein